MSSDNYYSIDYAITEPKPFGVTMGFMSDDESPTLGSRTAWFSTLTEAWDYAESEYAEYGVQLTQTAREYLLTKEVNHR